MYPQIYELKDAIALFLEHQGKDQLLRLLKNKFQGSLAHLADAVKTLNTMNSKLQGPGATLFFIILYFKNLELEYSYE